MRYLNKPLLGKYIKASLVFQFSLLFLWACDSSSYQVFKGATQGTQYHITAELPKTIPHQKIQEAIEKCLADIDVSLSTYRDDSEISKFNKTSAGTKIKVSREFINVLDISREVFRQSSGAFNPSVNDLVQLWGFGREISIQSQVVPDDQAINQAKLTMNFSAIINQGREVRKILPVKLDFNGVAQGYTVDVLGEVLHAHGIKNYMIEVGGEVATRGISPRGTFWRIGVEFPGRLGDESSDKVFAALLLNNANLATSGDYRDYYEIEGKRYSHTIDPESGRPISHKLASVTVLAKSTAHADAWATAFMVLGENSGFDLAERLAIPAYFIYRNKDRFDVKMTKAMQAYVEPGG